MEGQKPQFVIHFMFRSHVSPNNPNYIGANHYDAITEKNNLARQLYGKLEQIAEEEAYTVPTQLDLQYNMLQMMKVMLSNGNLHQQQQQVYHQYLQMKAVMLSDNGQLQQQQQVHHHLQMKLKKTLNVLAMLSDWRTLDSTLLIHQHPLQQQLTVNK